MVPNLSTATLYRNRNVNARRHLASVTFRPPESLPYFSLLLAQLRAEYSIQTPPPCFILTIKQQQLLIRFRTEFFHSFPNIACAYCGILSLPRSIKWEPYNPEFITQYQLQSVLNLPLTFNLAGNSVAICPACSRKPRSAPDVGPWTEVIFEVPQQWRRLLSPIQLHCNLGRTQSQSANGFHNPYSTYRTLKGTMYMTPSEPAISLFSGTSGAFLMANHQSHTSMPSDAILTKVTTAIYWLQHNNPLIQRYGFGPDQVQHMSASFPYATLSIPEVTQDWDHIEPPLPHGHPDIIVDPRDYHSDVHGEDHRYFRLPAGLAFTARDGQRAQAITNGPFVVPHGDPDLEALLFTSLYHNGKGAWHYTKPQNRVRGNEQQTEAARSHMYSQLTDAVIKLSSVVSHFRDNHHWPGYKYLEVEMQRIHQNTNRLLKVDKTNRDMNRPNGAQLLQQSMFGVWNIINEQVTSTIPMFIRTGDSYFKSAESNINAMLKSFGLPQLFITMTFSEQWPDLRNIMLRIAGPDTLCTDHPWECVEFYYERMHQLWTNYFRKPGASGFGILRESVIRYEFQLRQAIHSHMLMWTGKSILQLIAENYIRADMPDPTLEPELYRLVNAHQIHTCRPNMCGRSMTDSETPTCRKGFPHPLKPHTIQVEGELRYQYRRTKAEDRYVVLYNPMLLMIWQAHINVQYVTTAGLSKYVTKYVTKAEPKSIVDVQSEPDHLIKHLEARRMGSMEVMCLLTGKPILKLSAGVQYLPNSPPYLRTFTIRRVSELEQDLDNPYYPDAIEKYLKRLQDPIFEQLTYPQYYRNFAFGKNRRSGQQAEEWRDTMGNYVYRRSRVLLTRSAFRRLADGETFFYALLLEKGHWRAEEDFMGNCDTYRARFLSLFPQDYAEVIANQKVAKHQNTLIFTALYDEIVNTMLEQHSQLNTEFWKQLLQNQIHELGRPALSRALASCYDYSLHMESDQYNAYSIVTQFLGSTQQHNSQKLFFITGSAGVGKSFILSALEKWVQDRQFKYLKLAPTGIAAINIEGHTIHAALSIVSNDSSNRSTHFSTSIFNTPEKQQTLHEISVLLIDEISMVSAELLSYVSSIFAKLHGNGRPFGGIAVLAFGDLLQLPPVVGQPVFYANIWQLFCPLFLLRSHRQANDATWFALLNEIRVGNISEDVWSTLVEIHGRFCMSEVLPKATFIVSLRDHAQAINTTILDHIPNPPNINYSVDRSETDLLSLEQTQSSFKRETNLPDFVDIKVGSRVMFLDNSLIASGISNGSIGIVIGQCSEDSHPNVMFPTSHGIEVVRVTLVTRFLKIHGVLYSRTQYPLGNAFALTIHKTQSLGLDNIAIALDSSIFGAGQAYTGLSRAKEMSGVHISHLDRSAFIVDRNAIKEYERLQDIWQHNEVRLGRQLATENSL